MNVADVMEEIAARVRLAPSLAGRTYAYPAGSVTPPAAIVAYPSKGTFDESYGRGRDSMDGVIVVAVGRPSERQTRDQLTRYLDGSGPESIKALVDGDGTYASCDSVTVTGWETDVYNIGGTEYLVAVFALDIWGPGEGE